MRIPMVILSWNKMFSAPRILVGAISERNTGTACNENPKIQESVALLLLYSKTIAFHKTVKEFI